MPAPHIPLRPPAGGPRLGRRAVLGASVPLGAWDRPGLEKLLGREPLALDFLPVLNNKSRQNSCLGRRAGHQPYAHQPLFCGLLSGTGLLLPPTFAP